MSLGPAYTVTEHGLRDTAGNVESLGTDGELCIWKAAKMALFHRGKYELVTRTVTGRDHIFDEGLLAGAPIKLKARYQTNPGIPAVVESATEWGSSR